MREEDVFVTQSKIKAGKTDTDLEYDASKLAMGQLEEDQGTLEESVGSPPPSGMGSTMNVAMLRKLRMLKVRACALEIISHITL